MKKRQSLKTTDYDRKTFENNVQDFWCKRCLVQKVVGVIGIQKVFDVVVVFCAVLILFSGNVCWIQICLQRCLVKKVFGV